MQCLRNLLSHTRFSPRQSGSTSMMYPDFTVVKTQNQSFFRAHKDTLFLTVMLVTPDISHVDIYGHTVALF